jgi:hypothetical protein
MMLNDVIGNHSHHDDAPIFRAILSLITRKTCPMKKLQEREINRFVQRLAAGAFGFAACVTAAAQPATADESKPAAQTSPARGMTVHIDPQTGRVVPAPAPGTTTLQLSPAEQNRMSTSSEGLVEEPLPGGGYKLDLRGRFQSPLMATTGPDGKVQIQHMGERAGEAGHDHKH